VPQIPVVEFRRLPLRVHEVLTDIPLHDAWAVDLPAPRAGVTLEEFRRASGTGLFTPSPVVIALLRLRFFIGRIFGWDRMRSQRRPSESFANRLTDADRASSLAPAGTPEDRGSAFRVVYRFENEQLSEIINRTAHAAALTSLVETPNGYRLYFAVYVREVGRLTHLYMALIDPFRKFIVYPSLLRSVRANWNRSIAAE
jgi:hypothetical protein